MTPAEVAKVLTKAAAFDQRSIGESDVLAWHEVLAEVDFGDGLAAVTAHYADNTDRIMPAHVRRHADEFRRARVRYRNQQMEQLAIEEFNSDPTRFDRSEATRDLIRELRDRLPEGDPDKLRRPEWLEHERKRDRERTAEPNPLYDPAAHERLAEIIARADEVSS